MTRFTNLFGVALVSASLYADPQQRPATENERQPGTLRISGIKDTDQVLLDGELIGDGKRIAKFGSRLLVTPGEYTVTIVSVSHEGCESRVSIRENRTSVASCSTDSRDNLVD
jgi:hypothetical protein